jgi:hypothetical protein
VAYDNLSQQLESQVSPELRDQILEGREEVAKASKLKNARWVKCAMERMDALVDEPTRVRVMEQCGYKCAWRGRAEKIRKALPKCSSIEEFEDKLRVILGGGVGVERDGRTIITSYPRCYHGGLSGTEELISITFCHCGKGYWMAMFEHVFGKPVKVDILQTVITGADSCRFAIHIPEDEFVKGI